MNASPVAPYLALHRHASVLVEELAVLVPAEIVATCDVVGMGDILAELRDDPSWHAVLHPLASATRSYVRMRRASVDALVAGRLVALCSCPKRRWRLEHLKAEAEKAYIDRRRTYRADLQLLVQARARFASAGHRG
jgi:hypothetical protein